MASEPDDTSPRNSAARAVSSLNENDVLAGRGLGPSQFIGSKRFRDLVHERKQEYKSNPSYKAKKLIAIEVYNEVISRGGRFLKMVSDGKPAKNVVEEGVWFQVDKAEALGKCKQALREQKEDERASPDTRRSASLSHEAYDDSVAASPRVALIQKECLGDGENKRPSTSTKPIGDVQDKENGLDQPSTSSLRKPFRSASNTAEGPLLFHGLSAIYAQQAISLSCLQGWASQQMPSNLLLPLQLNTFTMPNSECGPCSAPTVPQGPPYDAPFHYHFRLLESHPDSSLVQSSIADPGSADAYGTVASGRHSDTQQASEASDPIGGLLQQADEMDALVGLSALSVSGLPTFTERQEEIERATMTNEERAEVLSDAFGKYCNVDAPQSKRLRRDLDSNSIQFLVDQTRVELSLIPEVKKQAFLEAQLKCGAFEFNDQRLERFLRSVGMNTKLAAHRFVNYWEERRKLFGQAKYWMRMTLSEALRDDLEAIQDGVIILLPHLDSSGRQVVVMEPHRRTPGKYSSESLLRAFWYAMEVVAQENTDINSGYVGIGWHKTTTVWDYDHSLMDRFISLERTCWPVRIIASHVCCPSSVFLNILRPILAALTEKRIRARTHWHDVPDSDLIVRVLSEYGIRALPIEMGGSVLFTQSQWMAHRRAVELEEIG